MGEKEIIKEAIKNIHFMDVNNISNLIEEYIYHTISYTNTIKRFDNCTDIIYITDEMRFDKKHGLSKVYYHRAESVSNLPVLSLEREYKNDKLDGYCKTFFPNGKVCDILFYKNGKRIMNE
jgi:hypothetical protein